MAVRDIKSIFFVLKNDFSFASFSILPHFATFRFDPNTGEVGESVRSENMGLKGQLLGYLSNFYLMVM